MYIYMLNMLCVHVHVCCECHLLPLTFLSVQVVGDVLSKMLVVGITDPGTRNYMYTACKRI